MRQYLPRTVIAQGIGGFYNQTMRALAYWSMVNSAILLVLGWDGTVGIALRGVMPWMTFPLFLAAVGGIALLLMLVDFLLVYPAVIAFTNRQAVRHDNPIFDKLVELQAQVGKLQATLNEAQKPREEDRK